MPTIAAGLVTASAATITLLGALHLLFTFRGPKLKPRDPELTALMARSALIITPDTTVWKAWVGFNASHSLGALLFGAVYGYLSLAHGALLLSGPFLMILGLVALIGYLILGIRYWFKAPLTGIALATALWASACALAWL